MGSFEVRIWSIRKRKGKSPYQLRWVVGKEPQAESFATFNLADSFRSKLVQAQRAGAEFDPVTGRPVSWGREVSWFDHAQSFVAALWHGSASGTRRQRAVALAHVTVALTAGKRGRPDVTVLRRALISWAFGPHGVPLPNANGNPVPPCPKDAPADIAAALVWIAKHAPGVAALRDLPTVRAVLDALTRNPDGKRAASGTFGARRAFFHHVLGHAVERGLLPSNPVEAVQWTRPKAAQLVDRRVLANPAQVAAILAAVPVVAPRIGDGLVAFYGCLYYAGMRPSEAIGLVRSDCDLPDTGWGVITLGGSNPYTSIDWSDTGQARERRSLKYRAAGEVRVVPIPPELVTLLRRHLDTHGTASGGRLFRTLNGGLLQASTYGRVWRNARAKALTAAQAASPLAQRPYDLRHACASLWLNSGVDATDVAERLGHSLEMLLKVYANCVDGSTNRNNARIAAALTASTATPAASAVVPVETAPGADHDATSIPEQARAA